MLKNQIPLKIYKHGDALTRKPVDFMLRISIKLTLRIFSNAQNQESLFLSLVVRVHCTETFENADVFIFLSIKPILIQDSAKRRTKITQVNLTYLFLNLECSMRNSTLKQPIIKRNLV